MSTDVLEREALSDGPGKDSHHTEEPTWVRCRKSFLTVAMKSLEKPGFIKIRCNRKLGRLLRKSNLEAIKDLETSHARRSQAGAQVGQVEKVQAAAFGFLSLRGWLFLA